LLRNLSNRGHKLFTIGLRAKFFALMLAIVLLLGATTIFFVKTSLRNNLILTLQQRGLASAKHVAGIAVSPVLMEQFFQLELLLRDLKASDEDIRYIFLLDSQGTVLAGTFTGGIPKGLREAHQPSPGFGHSIKRLVADDEEILDIAVPMLEGALGVIRLGLSGESVKKDVDEIINLIVWIIITLLFIGGLMAALFDAVITKPIIALADVARAVGRGDLERRVTFRASDEIGVLAQAFDSMIEKRGTAEREKENLIAELRKALNEIKRLEGLLPICAACKKIRDAGGSWTQIETFISERSNADFTHSICPECAKKMYPEFYRER
jgi:methyl-accepting chemotaxis protein